MATTRGESRADRLRQMEEMYVLQAYTDIELADRLNVERETVFKDRKKLMAKLGKDKWEELAYGRWKIKRRSYISNVGLNLNESLPLYLFARKSARQLGIAQPHVVNAMHKLALCIREPMTERLASAAERVRAQTADDAKLRVFEHVALAWVDKHKIDLDYVALHRTTPIRHTVSIYLIEPSVWSDAVYVVGYSEPDKKVMPFKLDRIVDTVLRKSDPIVPMPAGFDEHELLKHAWGIWAKTSQPVTVRLRFHGEVAVRRLRESRWHPLEAVSLPDAEGSVVWSAPIAEWQEMLPWVRGWGSAVAVLEPMDMRREIEREVRKMTQLYGLALQPQVTPKHYLFWAKMDKKTQQQHLLIYHMLDVGQMAQTLWSKVLPAKLKQRIAEWLQCSQEQAGFTIAFWASLHDLGKASPAFQNHPSLDQAVRDKVCQQLKQAGLNIPNPKSNEQVTRHEAISAWSLMPASDGDGEDLLASLAAVPRQWANLIGYMLSGHHGAWYAYDNLHSPKISKVDVGEVAWREIRTILFKEMQRIFQPHKLPDISTDNSESNVLMALVSGLVSVADWLGSDEDHFNYEDQFIPVDEYITYAAQKANLALEKVGWDASLPAADFDFAQIFQFSPKAAQIEVISALKKAQLPALAIIEAPMGYGKTEMALAVYAAWAQQMGEARLYVAMPTTATSNQMWDRVAAFLGKQHSTNIQPLLVHGQALLKEMQVTTHDQVSAGSEVVEDKGQQHHVTNQTWFLPRKKSLLVPFGVGTVDQSLMSVLQTKHFFVRLLGLANKVVIFDEVHAYDAYMTVLFDRLLIWLKAIGASVIVLSATLPQITRNKLLMAWDGKPNHATTVYPRLSWVDGQGGREALTLTPPPSKQLRYGWISRETMAIVGKLKEELRDGGCAVVICNTVTRAQTVYNAILEDDELKQINQSDLILFHARFPMVWREDIEKRVLNKFGPNLTDKQLVNPSRPKKAIVVATQVVEQSLDLDFDVMISDHAPVDLLLQRSGRLHRHQVNEANRKHSFVLWVALPEIIEDVPRFERSDTYVYAEYVLLRSWLALHGRPALTVDVPADVEGLIEQVYGEQDLGSVSERVTQKLKTTKQKLDEEVRNEKFEAGKQLIRKTDDEDLFGAPYGELDEDNPNLHKTFRAMTRNGGPNLNIICLHEIDNVLHFEPDATSLVYQLTTKINSSELKQLLRRSVSINRADIIPYFLNVQSQQQQAIITIWQKCAALRYHSVAIFKDGICPVLGTNYILKLTRKYGLQILKTTE